MSMRSGFFNSVDQDRLYDAGFFAEYFASFIGNGIFPNPSNNLQVMTNNDMSVTVNPGKAWIDGYILFNDTDYVFDIDVADGVLNRIDRIVARMDVANREITVQVKKGEFASNPVPKNLQRDADAYEVALADVRINAGVISITQANITDTRLNSDLCGIVHGVVEQVDTTTLFNQYQSWINQEKQRFENDVDGWLESEQLEFEDWLDDKYSVFEAWEQQQKLDFDIWFESIQNILDGNVAANLQNQITQLEEDLGNIDAPSTEDFDQLASDFNEHQAEKASLTKLGHVKAETDADGKLMLDLPKSNYNAVLKPTSTDDSSKGYSKGSVWIYGNDKGKHTTYICAIDTKNSAEWLETSSNIIPQFYESGIEGVDWVEGHSRGALGSVVKNTDHFLITTKHQPSENGFSVKSYESAVIDFSKYSTLKIEWENTGKNDNSNSSYFGITNKGKGITEFVPQTILYKTKSFARVVEELDVTGINSKAHISITLHDRNSTINEPNTLKIFNVWGE